MEGDKGQMCPSCYNSLQTSTFDQICLFYLQGGFLNNIFYCIFPQINPLLPWTRLLCYQYSGASSPALRHGSRPINNLTVIKGNKRLSKPLKADEGLAQYKLKIAARVAFVHLFPP